MRPEYKSGVWVKVFYSFCSFRYIIKNIIFYNTQSDQNGELLILRNVQSLSQKNFIVAH